MYTVALNGESTAPYCQKIKTTLIVAARFAEMANSVGPDIGYALDLLKRV